VHITVTFAHHGTFSAIFAPLSSVMYRPMKTRRMVIHVGTQTLALKIGLFNDADILVE
jgi:hypothetical protein